MFAPTMGQSSILEVTFFTGGSWLRSGVDETVSMGGWACSLEIRATAASGSLITRSTWSASAEKVVETVA